MSKDQSSPSTQQQQRNSLAPVPLTNLKNSCYMNSVVQSLAVLPQLLKKLQIFLNEQEACSRAAADDLTVKPEVAAKETSVARFPITTSLVKLFLEYEEQRQHSKHAGEMRYRLERLKEKVGMQSKQFLSDNQQDAGEFFAFLMDAASDEIRKAQSTNVIDDWLSTTTVTRTVCCSCHHASDPVTTSNTSTYLAAPEGMASEGQDKEEEAETVDLQRLLLTSLDRQQETEILESRCEQPGCDGRQTEVHRQVTRLPRVLVIQLSRISLAGQKLEEAIEVSPVVRLPPVGAASTDDVQEYELRSVVCHIGPSISKGHYYAFARNVADSEWYNCDDHEIRECDFDEVAADARVHGHCFFYQKRDLE